MKATYPATGTRAWRRPINIGMAVKVQNGVRKPIVMPFNAATGGERPSGAGIAAQET